MKILNNYIYNIISEAYKATIPDDKFLAILKKSNSISDIATKLNITPEQVRSKINVLRHKKGLQFKHFRKPSHDVDKAKFEKTWQKAKNADEVAKQFELSVKQVCNIAAKMREAGVNLKQFTTSVPKIDVEKYISQWNKAKSLDDAVVKLKDVGINTTKSLASRYTAKLRMKGYVLKDFKQLDKYVIKNKATNKQLAALWPLIPDEKILANILDVDLEDTKQKIAALQKSNEKMKPHDTNRAQVTQKLISVWNNVRSMKEFVRQTMINKDRVLHVVHQLRTAGIDMKKLEGEVSIAK